MRPKITRRRALAIAGGALATGVGYNVLANEDMEPAPVREGQVLCDLHAHPTHKAHVDDIVQALSAPGLVGLTVKDIDKSGEDILRYEQALDLLPGFKEIDKGYVSKIGNGYFARTQEIQAGKHHLLAVGCEGGYLPNFESVDDAVQLIHERKGLAILNHPFALIIGQNNIRLPKTDAERGEIRHAYARVDEVEVHNAYCIDLIPFILAMKQANRDAEHLRRTEFPHFKGTAGSDCHRRWVPIKITGIYVPKSVVEFDGMDGIKGAIKTGNFDRLGDAEAGPYISRGSFILGMGGDMLATLR